MPSPDMTGRPAGWGGVRGGVTLVLVLRALREQLVVGADGEVPLDARAVVVLDQGPA